MKRLYIVGILGTLVVGGMVLTPSKTSFEAQNEPVTIEKEVEVSMLDKRIKDAQDEAESLVTASAQQAYDKAYEQAMLEIELEVVSEFGGELNERIATLQASSTAY